MIRHAHLFHTTHRREKCSIERADMVHFCGYGLTITHNFRALREQPKGQVGDKKKGAADNTL